MGVEDRGQIDVSAPSAEIDLTEEEALRGFSRLVPLFGVRGGSGALTWGDGAWEGFTG